VRDGETLRGSPPFRGISCRRQALRAGAEAGRTSALLSERPIGRAEAKLLAREQNVPARWLRVFQAAFVRTAVVVSREPHPQRIVPSVRG